MPSADVLTPSPTGRKEQRMKEKVREIAVEIWHEPNPEFESNRDNPYSVYIGEQLIWFFPTIPAALAFCEYHKLTVTGYYKNGIKVEKEEME